MTARARQERMPQQAVLLAAGYGSRLRPLTDTVPKCMLPVDGRPIIEHVVRHLASYGVGDLLVNLHHCPSVIPAHFGSGEPWGVRLTYLHEPELLGTAGTVRAARSWLRRGCFVWYADNLSRCQLDRLFALHLARDAEATLATHHRPDPARSGVVATSADGRITEFREKPAAMTGPAQVNAGIYILAHRMIRQIPDVVPCDFGADVFPSWLAAGARLYARPLTPAEGLWWSDEPADLASTRAAWGAGR